MQRIVRKVLRVVADHDPDYYDMSQAPSETYSAPFYVERILDQAGRLGIEAPATLLEAGCQTGRLAVAFASRGFNVTGIDASGFALRRARRHMRSAGVRMELKQGDLVRVLEASPDRRYDIVVCAEVLYQCPSYRDMLGALIRAVRPGGLLCVSHRTRLYYMIEALRQADVESAGAVLERSEGPFRDSAYFNWQTRDELSALYQGLGMRWLADHPIDRLRWLADLDAAKLSPAQQQRLRELEGRLGDEGGGFARYLLVLAQRPAEAIAAPCG